MARSRYVLLLGGLACREPCAASRVCFGQACEPRPPSTVTFAPKPCRHLRLGVALLLERRLGIFGAVGAYTRACACLCIPHSGPSPLTVQPRALVHPPRPAGRAPVSGETRVRVGAPGEPHCLAATDFRDNRKIVSTKTLQPNIWANLIGDALSRAGIGGRLMCAYCTPLGTAYVSCTKPYFRSDRRKLNTEPRPVIWVNRRWGGDCSRDRSSWPTLLNGRRSVLSVSVGAREVF